MPFDKKPYYIWRPTHSSETIINSLLLYDQLVVLFADKSSSNYGSKLIVSRSASLTSIPSSSQARRVGFYINLGVAHIHLFGKFVLRMFLKYQSYSGGNKTAVMYKAM